MKYALIMTGVLGVIVPAQHASATQYYYCYTKVYNKDTLIHYTPVLSTEDDDIDERQTGFAFSDFAKSTAFSNGSIDTGCSSSSRLDVATRNYRSMLSAGQGSGRQVDWPNPPVPSQIATALPNEVSITSDSRSGPVSDMPSADGKKYVEVAGPNGTIRLSPEVAARNQAAAEDYRRKMEEHARAKAEHDRKLALHQESIAAAAAEKREYERRLAVNAAQVAAQKAQTANPEGGTEGTFQATSTYRATKEEAMTMLMGYNLPPITNVQCKEVTFYKPAKWHCWGTYRQTVTRSSTSKQ